MTKAMHHHLLREGLLASHAINLVAVLRLAGYSAYLEDNSLITNAGRVEVSLLYGNSSWFQLPVPRG